MKETKKLDSWAVAVAILLGQTPEQLHYNELTDRIVESKLTTIGEKGKTRYQTIRSMLGTKKINNHAVFYQTGDPGYYGLFNPDGISEHLMVKEALVQLQVSRGEDGKIKQLEDIIVGLKRKNKMLEETLIQIRSLCEFDAMVASNRVNLNL